MQHGTSQETMQQKWPGCRQELMENGSKELVKNNAKK